MIKPGKGVQSGKRAQESIKKMVGVQSLFDQRNETIFEGSQVKGTEHSTAQHSTVEDRKFKEREIISIIVS